MKQFVTYNPVSYRSEETLKRSKDFFEYVNRRRSIRHFSEIPVEKRIIENIIKTAGCAPSGAHKQPWIFCAIQDYDFKSRIRKAAEKEEYENYSSRMSKDWIKDLKPFGTDHIKPFLEIAPWLIVVMKKTFDKSEGRRKKNYYVNESVGIAVGFLLSAIHNAGLVALTHTPSPMNFLSRELKRPENEKPFLLIPVGYPAENVKVPNLKRKKLSEISAFY